MKCFIKFIIVILFLFIYYNIFAKINNNIKETALFKVDFDKKVVLGPASKVFDYLSLKLISVTTDQLIYWPDEEVFLKVIIPSRPNSEIKIILTKKYNIIL